MNKEIRFIDSKYNELFRIADGEMIQCSYPEGHPYRGEVNLIPCHYIDEYHTKIGSNVCHIHQFAQLMENNGATYIPEPKIEKEQAAWQIGRDYYLLLQTCDDGYDYTLYDQLMKEIDGGQLDMPELSMNQARHEILSDLKMENKYLLPIDYEEILEKIELVENSHQSIVDKNLNTTFDLSQHEINHCTEKQEFDEEKSIVDDYEIEM